MEGGGGCSVTHIKVKGVWMARPVSDLEGDCPDCGCGPGKLHHYICNVAKCAACGGEEVHCKCVTEELRGIRPG